MNTVTVQVAANRFEVRTPDEFGNLIGIFTSVQDAVAFSQAYSLARY